MFDRFSATLRILIDRPFFPSDIRLSFMYIPSPLPRPPSSYSVAFFFMLSSVYLSSPSSPSLCPSPYFYSVASSFSPRLGSPVCSCGIFPSFSCIGSVIDVPLVASHQHRCDQRHLQMHRKCKSEKFLRATTKDLQSPKNRTTTGSMLGNWRNEFIQSFALF